jgi:hypothetical protein
MGGMLCGCLLLLASTQRREQAQSHWECTEGAHLGKCKRRTCSPCVWSIQHAHLPRCACRISRPARTRTSCCCSGSASSICWVPNTGTGGPLALCAGTGGQLAHTTGTRGVGMDGGLPYSTGVACSLIAPWALAWGCSADGVMGDKGACCCVPDARAVLYSGTRAALHVRGVCGGRYVLLVPLAPLDAVAGAASCPATGVVGGKGARYHLPNARTVLYGGTRAALHVRCVRSGRCVPLAALAPLARLG